METIKNGEIERLAGELIKIESLSNEKKNLHEVIDFVKNLFLENEGGIHIEQFEVNGFPSIIIQNFEGKKADITLNGHLDVVPPSQEGQFQPYIKDGKLWGRGSADMKGAIAAMILVFKKLINENYKTKKVALMLNTDEEVSGQFGALALANQGYIGDVVIIPDGGSERNIVTKQKGILRITLSAKGKSAHASKPWLGINPNDILIKTYLELKQKIHQEFQMEGEDKRGTTLTLTCLLSGEQVNKIPDMATAKIDIRFTEDYRLKTLKDLIQEICQKNGCEVVFDYGGEIMDTDETNKLVLDYKTISQEILGKGVQFGKEHSGSDGRFFSLNGSQVILHRPECANLHAENEWIEIDGLYKFAEIVYNYIKR